MSKEEGHATCPCCEEEAGTDGHCDDYRYTLAFVDALRDSKDSDDKKNALDAICDLMHVAGGLQHFRGYRVVPELPEKLLEANIFRILIPFMKDVDKEISRKAFEIFWNVLGDEDDYEFTRTEIKDIEIYEMLIDNLFVYDTGFVFVALLRGFVKLVDGFDEAKQMIQSSEKAVSGIKKILEAGDVIEDCSAALEDLLPIGRATKPARVSD